MKKSEWEETQGNGAILWPPAGTSSSETCLINPSELVCGTQREPVWGGALTWGWLPCWRPSSALWGIFLSHSGGMSAEDFLGPGCYLALSARPRLMENHKD